MVYVGVEWCICVYIIDVYISVYILGERERVSRNPPRTTWDQNTKLKTRWGYPRIEDVPKFLVSWEYDM